MVPTGRIGKMRLGEVSLSWNHGTSGLQGQKEITEGLFLDPTHQNLVSQIWAPKEQDIPTTSTLGVVCVLADPCHLEDPGPEVVQTCVTGVPSWLCRREID